MCEIETKSFPALKRAGRTRGGYGDYIQAVHVVTSVEECESARQGCCNQNHNPGDILVFDGNFGWLADDYAAPARVRQYAERIRSKQN